MNEEIETEGITLTPLQKAQQKRREMFEQGVEVVRLTPVEKAKANPKSKSLAIVAHCWECVGGDSSENPRKLVRECGLESKCSLWPHRPWQKDTAKELSERDNIFDLGL